MRMSGQSNLSIGSKGPKLLIRPLDCPQNFLEDVFFGVAMEWLVDDEDVWSVECKYQLKKAMAFDPTVGSRSKFHRGFHMLFSLG